MALLAAALAVVRAARVARMNVALPTLAAFVHRSLEQREFQRIERLSAAIDETVVGPALGAANRAGVERAKDARATEAEIGEAMRAAFDAKFAERFAPIPQTRWMPMASLVAAACSVGLEVTSERRSIGPLIVAGIALAALALTVRGVAGVRRGAKFLAPLVDAYAHALRTAKATSAAAEAPKN